MSKIDKSKVEAAEVKPVDIADLEAVVGGAGLVQSQVGGTTFQPRAYTTMCWSTMCSRPGISVNPVINPVIKR